jgi:branched-chain amino acid transport system substrate-binding protein
MRQSIAVASALVLLVGGAVACTSNDGAPIHVGAIYPLSGSQGPGGRDEFRGVSLATDMINADGGVRGRQIELTPIDVAGGDQAPAAVDSLADQGIRFVLGSYGSTISEPAAAEAARRGLLFWETGAVGSSSPGGGGSSFFRVAPSGEKLGRDAISFVSSELAPKLHRSPASLRWAVANVDDVYGASVADGAIARIHSLGLPFAGRFVYDPRHLDAAAVVRRIAAVHPDVLFVSAYVDDGIALRRAMVHQHLRLVTNIGTSSSYCMPAFGAALGRDAVGLFSSDKLDSEYVDPHGLTAAGREIFDRAREAYEDRYGEEMSAAALAGFSAAWALFDQVLLAAPSITPSDVAATALATRMPVGSLPNGSGLAFAPPGSPDPGANLRAMSVIWEWVKPRVRAVVWPQRFATAPIAAIRIAS